MPTERAPEPPPTSRRPRIFLHIGAMKTGTTYLQQLLTLNKGSLATAGYLFPGATWAQQSHAARDVLSRGPSGHPGRWAALSTEMLTHPGPGSVFSMEFLSFADPPRAARIVDSLAGAEVHVILTVRDTAQAVPGQWQTSCRNAGTVPWPRLVQALGHAARGDAVAAARPDRMFQRTQGIPRMLEVWVPVVGTERVHVVTVPPKGSGPRVLWERFAAVLGIDPQACPLDPVSANVSMGHPSTEMLRRVNVELGKLPPGVYERTVRGPMRPALAAHSSAEPRIRLNRGGAAKAARFNRRIRAAVTELGVPLVGDPDDLPVTRPDPATPTALYRPTATELLDAAEVMWQAMHEQLGTGPAGPVDRERWQRTEDPVQAAARDVAEVIRRCAAR